MKTGLSLTELAREIERRQTAKRDFIAPIGRLAMSVDQEKKVPVLALQGSGNFEINDVAHGQIAEFADIPMKYYRRMATQDPSLLARNVNRWLIDKNQDQRMVRTLDGKVRAVLSDKYRALENEELAEAILPVLLEQDLIIMSSQITETRLYIKAVDRRILKDVPTGRKLGDGSHVFFDTVSPAITISNSEVGHGALSIETGVYTKVCTNLAMIGTNMRKYHTGARADVSDEVFQLLSDGTKKLTDAAVWGQVRDIVTAAFDKDRFSEVCKKLSDATEDKIEGDIPEIIEVVGKRMSINDTERKGILSRLIEGGDLTRYGLHSAITRHSADIVDYDRATELERMGGKVIELPKSEWQTILRQAA
jgi:hypothetical protein